MSDDRTQRLEKEHRLLEQLASSSEILSLVTEGDPVDRYELTFAAKLVERANDSTDEIHWTDHHKIELELPWSFPKTPPDIRWLTRFYHPNVSSSGFVSLSDIGLQWDSNISLDVITERLWDVARHAWYELESASNYSARRWIKGTSSVEFPVDQRTIVPQKNAKPENIISYRKKGATDSSTDQTRGKPLGTEELEIIEDSNPGTRSAKKKENDVIYLGDADIVDAEIVPPKNDGGDDDVMIIE